MVTSQVVTLLQLQQLFFDITQNLTGLPSSQIRQAYQANSQPAWEITENVVVIHVMQVDNAYDKQFETNYLQPNDTTSAELVNYTRVINVMWHVYGPTGFDIADSIRWGILEAPARGLLSNIYMYPIPGIQAPQRVPYLFNSKWWERNDVSVLFNLATLRVTAVPFLESATIEIIDDKGLQRVIEVQE